MLSEKRKADRQKMAAELVEIVEREGCKVTVDNKPPLSPRAVWVNIEAPRGLRVTIDLDGETTQPGVYVNAWNIDTSHHDTCLSDRFPGSVNQFHFSKSTTVCHSFAELRDHVRHVLRLAVDGSIFDAEREAEQVAKNGTWQDRQARWDSYWAEKDAQSEEPEPVENYPEYGAGRADHEYQAAKEAES